jgi:hypothetical protein
MQAFLLFMIKVAIHKHCWFHQAQQQDPRVSVLYHLKSHLYLIYILTIIEFLGTMQTEARSSHLPLQGMGMYGLCYNLLSSTMGFGVNKVFLILYN